MKDTLLKVLMVDDASVLKWGRCNLFLGLTAGFLLIVGALFCAISGRTVATDQEKAFQSIAQRVWEAERANPQSSDLSRKFAGQQVALINAQVAFMERLPRYVAFFFVILGATFITTGVLFARFRHKLIESQPHCDGDGRTRATN